MRVTIAFEYWNRIEFEVLEYNNDEQEDLYIYVQSYDKISRWFLRFGVSGKNTTIGWLPFVIGIEIYIQPE